MFYSKVCCAPQKRYTINEFPPPGACGTQQLKDRVFGGANTTISDYPWYVEYCVFRQVIRLIQLLII